MSTLARPRRVTPTLGDAVSAVLAAAQALEHAAASPRGAAPDAIRRRPPALPLPPGPAHPRGATLIDWAAVAASRLWRAFLLTMAAIGVGVTTLQLASHPPRPKLGPPSMAPPAARAKYPPQATVR